MQITPGSFNVGAIATDAEPELIVIPADSTEHPLAAVAVTVMFDNVTF